AGQMKGWGEGEREGATGGGGNPPAQARSAPHGRSAISPPRRAIGRGRARESDCTARIRADGWRSAVPATRSRVASDLPPGDGPARPMYRDRSSVVAVVPQFLHQRPEGHDRLARPRGAAPE